MAVTASAQLQTALQTQTEVCEHVSQFLLDQLIGCQGATVLLAIQHVTDWHVCSNPQMAPEHSRRFHHVLCAVQAGKRPHQATHVRKCAFFGNANLTRELIEKTSRTFSAKETIFQAVN